MLAEQRRVVQREGVRFGGLYFTAAELTDRRGVKKRGARRQKRVGVESAGGGANDNSFVATTTIHSSDRPMPSRWRSPVTAPAASRATRGPVASATGPSCSPPSKWGSTR